ncbi:hypothetical protein H8356DRAFT_947657 [Neocallimastix lanati (nom. inval.)]|uniref:EGF-like domain-containing protein n=1 Tax=Neocallimastix californiae TaxID=1754190 RepID=A0A1Y2AKC1_9FUNG|nr:hypothetical protein H8356DRAFT_947657 [Neocallimastix sp. JGI-2020a]ORY22942.1 hypothetical protein LY90DRAFT_515252 [Neocallimastix californiae]|eukprot:ORY22942.1 hypothetical protein LY90DRAFT_515252 [Neocallimastix californiae]
MEIILLCIYYLIINIFYIPKIYAKEFIIKNNDENFYNLNNFLNSNQNSNELVLYFVDNSYDMSLLKETSIEVLIQTNVSFIEYYSFVFSIAVSAYSDFYHIIFENCIFESNYGEILTFMTYCVEQKQMEPQIQFNRCKFINNYGRLIYGSHFIDKFNSEPYKCSVIKLTDCKFISNDIYFYLSGFKFIFENCYFTKINGNQNTIPPLFMSENSYNFIRFNNTIFKDIHAKNKLPLIHSSKSIIEIENTIFSNCSSNYGYLFDIKRHKNFQYIMINNSTFTNVCSIFYGEYTNFNITNSLFKNINLKNSIVAIIDSKYSNIKIKNCDFYNLTLSNSLFEKESFITMDNVKFKNIKSNSKTVLYTLHNDIAMNNIEVDNVSCIGDSGDSSFILFNSNETNKKITIKNFYAKNCISNGSFITIIDHIINVGLELISNTCNNNFAINGGALYLEDGINIDKHNNKDITIKNNVFNENTAYNFGGAIYSKFSKLYLATSENNIIINNKAGIMGGGIYSPNLIKYNVLNINNNCTIKNNTINSFENNYASKPSYILLKSLSNPELNNINVDDYINNSKNKPDKYKFNITSGDHLPLSFFLYDEFNNIVNDITKYYSSLVLKLTVTPSTNLDKEETSRINNLYSYLSGNIGSFLNGTCEFRNFKINAIPGIYNLNIIIENYNDYIEIIPKNIEITVNECNNNQITMYYKKSIISCINPICNSRCKKEASICKPYYKENINDINKNICLCLKGWKGTFCEEKEIMKFE